ncbi:MAG: LPS assembly protein LptD [Pseudomonadota bacterium]
MLLRKYFSVSVLYATLALSTQAQAQTDAAAQTKQDEQVLFEADNFALEGQNGPVIAEGNVRAYTATRILIADKVIYDQEADVITATGNVSLTEEGDAQTKPTVIFADQMELTGDMRDGVAESFRALLADNARIAASHAVRREGVVNRLTRGVYSACRVCDENGRATRPTWRMKAFKVKQDADRKVIVYNHAILEVKGVPILYTPYFRQPDPSVDRQSGFLGPELGNSGELGFFFGLPYHLALSPHYDATIEPLITEIDGTLWQGEWRQRLRNGQYVFQGGVINTDRRNRNNDRTEDTDWRWHYFGEGEFELPRRWRVGFDVSRTSDNTYIQRYDIEREGELRQEFGVATGRRLTSNAFAEHRTDNTRLRLDSYVFQGLRANTAKPGERPIDDAGLIPYVLPEINYEHDIAALPVIGGRTTLRSNFLALNRTGGVDTQRLSVGADWRRTHTTKRGHKLAAFGEVRGDAYYSSDLQEGTELLSGTDLLLQNDDETTSFTARALPTVGAEWSFPLIRRTKNATHVIEPIAQIAVSPVGGNPDDIINEDSQSFEFDTASLFRYNKSTGYDIWEDGQRANLGVKLESKWDNGLSLGATIGQTFRAQESSAFDANSGLDGTKSDIVGVIEASLGRRVSITNRFRIDNKEGTIRRAESSARANIWRAGLSATYLRLDESVAATGAITNSEQLAAAARFRLTNRWGLVVQAREDLFLNQSIDQRYGLTYRDDCTLFTIAYRRDSREGVDIRPSDSIFFTLELRTLIN